MATKTVPEQGIPAGTWQLDPVHSTARFEVTHSEVSTFRGGFGSIDARLVGGEDPVLEGSVDAASIDIAEEQLKGHLLSPEFFDVERTPKVRFRSSELRVGEDGELEVQGTLEIAGATREVAASGRVGHVPAFLDGKARLGLTLEAKVDRSDFGLDWNADLPSGGKALGYEVGILASLEFVREDA